MKKIKNIYATEFIKNLEEKDEIIQSLEFEISTMNEEIDRLKSIISQYRLDAVKQLREDLPEIEDTFRNWYQSDDDDDDLRGFDNINYDE